MARPLVIYHGPGCADGFCAAWVANRYFKGAADFMPAQYGDPVPDVAGREVYILDFSWKAVEMKRLVKEATVTVVLDHHKTAQEELRKLGPDLLGRGECRFDMEKSGGRLAWEYFYGQPGTIGARQAPWLVDYTEDRDLWRWKLPDSREVSAFLASHPFDFKLWDMWAGTLQGGRGSWEQYVIQGAAILRYQAQQVENLCKSAVETEMDGHKVLTVNTPILVSEVGNKLAEGRPFGVCWFVPKDGRIVYSLRSAEDGLDVSEIARAHGGGGHKHAAGFQGEE